MSRIGWNPGLGWLMYAGNLGGKCALITGNVTQVDVEVRQDVIDVTSMYSPVRQTIGGPREMTIFARMDHMTIEQQGQAPAVDMKALMMLARQHPDEYARLCEAEAVLRALGG